MVFKAKAYAKTNLYLDIVGKRENGYHDIDTIMQSVSVYDTVTLQLKSNGFSVKCDDQLLCGEDNIAFKACVAFAEHCGYNGGADVYIKKRIPVAAGMGGGSADAAAVLLLLNKATGKHVSLDELTEIAAKLGADVPFFLIGGTARAQGIGERLSALPSAKLYFVFLKQFEKQSTGKMYSVLDTVKYPKNGNIDSLIDGLKNTDIEKISSNIFNAFEFCWDFPKMVKPFADFNSIKVFLSGSGPTVCAVFSSEELALNCSKALTLRGLSAFYAETVEFGTQFE